MIYLVPIFLFGIILGVSIEAIISWFLLFFDIDIESFLNGMQESRIKGTTQDSTILGIYVTLLTGFIVIFSTLIGTIDFIQIRKMRIDVNKRKKEMETSYITLKQEFEDELEIHIKNINQKIAHELIPFERKLEVEDITLLKRSHELLHVFVMQETTNPTKMFYLLQLCTNKLMSSNDAIVKSGLNELRNLYLEDAELKRRTRGEIKVFLRKMKEKGYFSDPHDESYVDGLIEKL